MVLALAKSWIPLVQAEVIHVWMCTGSWHVLSSLLQAWMNVIDRSIHAVKEKECSVGSCQVIVYRLQQTYI